VPIARFLRVVTFQPSGSESPVDAALREAIVPRLLDHDEVVDAWIGRQSSRSLRTRVLASTWTAEPQAEPLDLVVLQGPGVTEGPPIVDRVDHVALAVHARFDRPEPARILRVFRGRARPGELDDYVAEARSGMSADAEVNDGLIAFALGIEPPDAFIAVSVWTGWSAIEQATGGNTRRPFSTRNADRLVDFRVVHFEILPETPTRR
jgi:hypothetical protein